MDTVIYCVGLPYPSHRLHPVLMRTTVEAAKMVKVARLVLVSSVYGYGVPRSSRVAETHSRNPHTQKGKYRKEQEDIVLGAHAAGGLQSLIVRLPDFYGPNADVGLANPIFHAALQGKTANWVGPVNTLHEFVFVPDTGPVIADLASRDECFGEAWNFGGPGVINTMDFITRDLSCRWTFAQIPHGGRRNAEASGTLQPHDARGGRDALPSGDARHSG